MPSEGNDFSIFWGSSKDEKKDDGEAKQEEGEDVRQENDTQAPSDDI